MTDAVGQAAASALHGPMQSLLRDVVQSRVIPAFEHSTQTMANQVNTAFQEGTKECQSPTSSFFTHTSERGGRGGQGTTPSGWGG